MFFSSCLLIALVVLNFIVLNTSPNTDFVEFCGYNEFLNFIKLINIVIIVTISIFSSLFIVLSTKKMNISRISKIMILSLFVILSFIQLLSSIKLLRLNYYSIEGKIGGNSMYPTFCDEDSIVIEYRNQINRFDIVVFKINKDSNINHSSAYKYYIKRVIGLPNDKVTWENNKLYINNELVIEDYINGYYDNVEYDSSAFNGIFTYIEDGIIKETDRIPEGYCFVLGDNRQKKDNGDDCSEDSRAFGLVPITNIIGIVQ